MKLTFVLAKHPSQEPHGDTITSGVLLSVARALGHEVSIIALTPKPEVIAAEPNTQLLKKPPVNYIKAGVGALKTGRSLLHARFDFDVVYDAVRNHRTDAFVAVHPYMAEPILRARPDCGIFVSQEVRNADVWRESKPIVGKLQYAALRRDEARIVRSVTGIGTYDRADVDRALGEGANRAVWLPITLPPRPTSPVGERAPRLLLVGDRRWYPNAQAAERLIEMWPAISAWIPDAELVLVGHPNPKPRSSVPSGVTDLGFVDDLDAVMETCRAFAAPIQIGGGVRVKLLTAAAYGLPIVASSAAIGSLDQIFGLAGFDTTEAFVGECRRILMDPDAATAEGTRLHAQNAAFHASGSIQRAFTEWIEGTA